MTFIAGSIINTENQFDFFVAQPVNMHFRQQRVEVLQFQGVDDAAFRFLGKGSRLWQLQTRTDLISETLAWTELEKYRDLIGEALQQIKLLNEDFDLRNEQVKVLDIQAGYGDFPPVRSEKGVGFANVDGSRFIASAVWDLMWIDKP